MNRYTWSVLALVVAGMVALAAAALGLFSQSLARQRELAHERMQSVAAYSARRLERILLGRFDNTGPEPVTSWLEDLSGSAGFERIVIADSLGLVHYSSQNVIRRGDDIGPYLIDTARFAAAAHSGNPRFTGRVRIDDTHFKSLYYPFDLGDIRYLAIVEADEEYFAMARQFRNAALAFSAFLLMVVVALGAAVTVISNRAREAMALARRNDELAFLGKASSELAHELKNPIAIVKSSADVLRKKYDPEKTHKAFDFLSEEIMRLSNLVGDILSFSREKRLRHEPFSAREVLDSFVASFAEVSPGVSVSATVDPALRLTGDPEAFRRIAANLVRNAAEALQDAGTVTISHLQEGKRMALRFEDNGPGIPPALRARLFDPFVSGKRAGSGLGLAIARSLCE
ncbi:MAG: hypothetical protein GF418_14025, partial [Chitinivibrionales bacterium]|nr:hypothetical protein [Chitinivibrionales bacterium]MBD3396736.1 hypothetical protein [Chitinivibrionales bacterium]